MNKLTAEIARRDISHLREHQANPKVGLSMREELYLQALEIALPVLEHGGWISCSERMPEDHEDVMCSDGNRTVIAFWFDNDRWLFPGSEIKEVTHWMPLPGPPQPQPSTNPQIDNDGGKKCCHKND